jgi:hypothetical protein
MVISQLIEALQEAQKQHGDLPVFTIDGDIERLEVHACREGVSRVVDGVPETPTELILEFIPA